MSVDWIRIKSTWNLGLPQHYFKRAYDCNHATFFSSAIFLTVVSIIWRKMFFFLVRPQFKWNYVQTYQNCTDRKSPERNWASCKWISLKALKKYHKRPKKYEIHLRLFAHYILYKITFSPQTLLAIDFNIDFPRFGKCSNSFFPRNLKEKETQYRGLSRKLTASI